MNHARYKIVLDHHHLLLIKDLGPWDQHKTVTNDAAHVVEELASRLGGRWLYYLDSDGQLDQILVQDGRFAGFKPA